MSTEPQSNEELTETTLNIPFPDSFVYANCAAFSISQADIRISFAEALPNEKVVPKVGIVMTPDQAAVTAILLLGQINIFEKTFGKIRNPQWRAFSEGAEAMTNQLRSQKSDSKE